MPRRSLAPSASARRHAGIVRAADVAHLAGAHEIVERAHRLVDRRARVEGVHLVEVDDVGLQAAEAFFAGADDVVAREADVVRAGAHRAGALRREDQAVAVAALAHPATDDLLGAADGLERAAERIDVGGVEEVDAALDGAVEDGERRLLVALIAEGHRAEAERRDLQAGAAERAGVHAGLIGCVSVPKWLTYDEVSGSKSVHGS